MNESERHDKVFMVKFIVKDQIQTQISSKNVNVQEAIGLLEMAKDQLLDNMRKNTKNVFNIEDKK